MRSVPAAEVEEAVVAQVRHLLRTPEIIVRTWAAAKNELHVPEREVVAGIRGFVPLNLTGEETYLTYAKAGVAFLRQHAFDRVNGGAYSYFTHPGVGVPP